MQFEYTLESLNRLSQVTQPKHIKSLSNALFPGTHCPLFGAAMSCCEIDGLEALVIGTDECTYYTQAFAIDRTAVKNNFWSYSMEHGDIVFGSGENVKKAARNIFDKRCPKAILLITTCVPEITGEDFDAIAAQLTDELQVPVMAVHTEHFRCNSHISGIENTLTALAALMKAQPVKEKTVNVLGHRFGRPDSSELFTVLKKKGYQIGLTVPSKCSVTDIEAAPAAGLNIVTDFTALPLARQMRELFQTPYVVFDKFLSVSRIDASYNELSSLLGIDFAKELEMSRAMLIENLYDAKARLAGKSFIYGNSVMAAFEVSSFLCGLGMEPIVIQARDLYQNDDIYIGEILAHGCDPYVSSIANIAPLRSIYPVVQPDFYIGHENPADLIKHGILQVTFDTAAASLGYELPLGVVDHLLAAMDGKSNPMLAMMSMAVGGGR